MKNKILLFLFSLTLLIKTGYGVDFAFYCKCYCPPNSTIVKVKDCSICNKNLCIEQKLCITQNSTTTTSSTSNKPRSIQDLDNQYSSIDIKTSLLSYTEYLYASLLGKVKRDYMFNENDIENFEKRKEKPINKELDNKEKSNESKLKDEKSNETKIKDEKSKDEENNNNKETPTETNKSSNTTIEEETVIHIIESGTDNGYRKNEEENWMTECFKRGSIKDEIIIILFLSLTGILLIYAFMKKCFANNYEDGMKYNYQTLNNSN